MNTGSKHLGGLVHELEERAKELNCLYQIEDLLNDSRIDQDTAFKKVTDVIPQGWQFSAIASAKIVYKDKVYTSAGFSESQWFMKSDIKLYDNVVGSISVYYINETPASYEGPFLKEERRLLNTISDRLSYYILHQESKSILNNLKDIKRKARADKKGSWQVILEMLEKTDPSLFNTIMRKLLHHLCWSEIPEAEELLQKASAQSKIDTNSDASDENKPIKITHLDQKEYKSTIIRLTEENFNDNEILLKLQKWIYEDKTSGLVKAVENFDTSLNEISETLNKHYPIISEQNELSPALDKGLRVSLLRRFFTDQLSYISIAKEFVDLKDFNTLTDSIILPAESHGKLGGKSAGLFLASKILEKCGDGKSILENLKTPKTWYIPSDGIIQFMQYNNLEEVIEQKYKDIEDIRREYPHIIQIFKNAQFPPEMVRGLSVSLDDLGDVPLIVRSSSLLEDQMGAAFSGKYKSLFLANQGTKQEKLDALMDAVSEVYASTFNPDAIEYRAERGLLDFHEEMGILLQQVVGTKVGKYFFPSFAGVAFSNNEFRWSPRIKRSDGLLRIVPGLGTRAVDRLSDDYPLLIAPGQPNLRVNASVEESIKYSPSKIDVINLDTNEFESKEIKDLFRECGGDFPGVEKLISLIRDNHILQSAGRFTDFSKEDIIVSFDGLITKTNFIKQVKFILDTLGNTLNTPVDIEFASDGSDFYLLQCRPQSQSKENKPDPIPRDIPRERILFTACKHISNGKVPEISHIVYIDSQKYNELEDRSELLAVGKAVGKLNKLLPKRQFILMGPGRWGSRGDIKLGVSVTYSDINNTSMLIEIARKKGNYTPDLSFGTHFFQDLVEKSIRYLPLYPDEKGNIFNEHFLNSAKNIFVDLLPEHSSLSETVRVIDVPKSTEGQILRVLVNADIDEAVAIFTNPVQSHKIEDEPVEFTEWQPSSQWKWRYQMAEKITEKLNAEKYGIKGAYIFGSTKNATAGPGSDIDLLIHIGEYNDSHEELKHWFEGWSLCLSEMNFLKTGYKTGGLLDVHFVTDEDIKNKTSWAVKINAVTDPARKLL